MFIMEAMAPLVVAAWGRVGQPAEGVRGRTAPRRQAICLFATTLGCREEFPTRFLLNLGPGRTYTENYEKSISGHLHMLLGHTLPPRVPIRSGHTGAGDTKAADRCQRQ